MKVLPRFFLSAIGVFLATISIGSGEEFCSLNKYPYTGATMDFTKELTDKEFAIVGQFKSLHCCGKGYRSIEWFKDGRPYPWNLDLSTLIINPKSANQTILTQSSSHDDEGVYECVLRNGTVTKRHAIRLQVFEKIPDEPKITYVSNDKDVSVGDSLRLFCEAFGGRVNLPDAHNEAIWRRQLSNGTIADIDSSRIKQQKVEREENQTFGTYLIFTEIDPEDFGSFVCTIRIPGNTIERTVEVRETYPTYAQPPNYAALVWTVLAVLLAVVVVAFAVSLRCIPKLQVMYKDMYGAIEECDGKSYDVLIAYGQKDEYLILGVLIPNLASKSYRCLSKRLSTNVSNWSSELSDYNRVCRRIVVVLSPGSLKDCWNASIVNQALRTLRSVTADAKLICVTLKDLPAKEGADSPRSVAREVRVIPWKSSKNEVFWLSLRKELPPKRETNKNGAGIA